MVEKILLDSDPGHDDTIAIMLAAKNPSIELLGITVVSGNQTLEKTVNNTLKVCSHLDIDVPIAAGMEGPLVRDKVTAGEIHGKTGLDGPKFGEIKKDIQEIHGVMFIIDSLMKSKEKLTLVVTGPMTNIAMALKMEPRIREKIKRIIFMGGSMTMGNTTPSAEFNIYADPEAAHIVLTSGVPLVMMGLDITRKVRASKEVLETMKLVNNKASKLFLDMMDFYIDNQKKHFGIQAPPIHDPVTLGYIIDPDIYETKDMYVEVDLSKGLSYGRTVCDYYGNTGKKPNVKVALDINSGEFWNTLYETFKLY